MSVFEKNVEDLVRRAAAAPDPKAKARFLRAAEERPERLSWKLAAAAAAALVVVTIVWSARTEQPGKSAARAAAPVEFRADGGDYYLKARLTLDGGRLKFAGRAQLPEGFVVLCRVQRLEEAVQDKKLVTVVRDAFPVQEAVQKGVLDFDWEYKGPARIRIEASAPNSHQDTEILKKVQVPEDRRVWTFEFPAWTEKLAERLGPQLVEVTDLARELKDLVAKAEAACASEERFNAEKKELIRQAERIQSRAANFAAAGLYPASAHGVEWTARDLATSMAIFKWTEKKFEGPQSYYTDGKKAKTHRNEPFDFDLLRGYLDDAVFVAGREFGLWILAELKCGRIDHEETLLPHASKPGLVGVAGRLQGAMRTRFDQDMKELQEIEEILRTLKK